ncbi:hypothetical protein B0H14DRAFT_2756528 [Mycena olivaceomarginata]|nr:hypothetical protein B0H14DRAFT_2756528 [Mycena olivaceomarginata]
MFIFPLSYRPSVLSFAALDPPSSSGFFFPSFFPPGFVLSFCFNSVCFHWFWLKTIIISISRTLTCNFSLQEHFPYMCIRISVARIEVLVLEILHIPCVDAQVRNTAVRLRQHWRFLVRRTQSANPRSRNGTQLNFDTT